MTRAKVLAAAVAKFGTGVNVSGTLSTVGPARNPYARDGRKEFHVVVRRAPLVQTGTTHAERLAIERAYDALPPFHANVTAPTAAEAWVCALAEIGGAS